MIVADDTTTVLDSADAYPRGWEALLAVTVLCLVCAVLTMDVSIVGLLIEPIKHDLHLADWQLGILLGPASSIAYALCAIPAGLLVDRFHRVYQVLAAVTLWSAAMLAMAFATSFWIFILAKIVVGIVMAILLTAPFSLLADIVAPERRARATSILVIGQYVGGAIGFLLGGLVFDQIAKNPGTYSALFGALAPWRITYILFVLPCILVLPFLAMMKEPVRKERLLQTGTLAASAKELLAYKSLLWPLFCGYALQVVGDSTIRAWLAPALMRSYNLTPGQFGGWIGGIILIGGIAGSALGGWFAERAYRRGSRKVTSVVVAAIVAGGCSTLAIMPNVQSLFVLFAIGTVASAIVATVLSAAMILYVPNELRGLSSGVLILLAVGPGLAIGPALAPAVSGALGSGAGLGSAIALIGVPSCFLAALFFSWLRTDAQAAATPASAIHENE